MDATLDPRANASSSGFQFHNNIHLLSRTSLQNLRFGLLEVARSDHQRLDKHPDNESIKLFSLKLSILNTTNIT